MQYRGPDGTIFIHHTMLERCRELRKNQTKAEEFLWELLKDRRFYDLKFRRQHHMPPYIADFYCYEKKLIIELDGDSHLGKEKYDLNRDLFFKENGFKVLRLRNEGMIENAENVLERIRKLI